MYRLQSKNDDVLDLRILNKKVYHKVKNEDYRLYERDITTFDVLWKSELQKVSDFAVTNTWLIFDSDETDKTIILNTTTKENCFLVDNRFVFDENLITKQFLLGNSRRKSFVINLLSKEVKEFAKDDYSFILIKGCNVICRNKLKTILTCRNIDNGLFEKWQFDITQFGTYKEKIIFADKEPEERQREIKRVYYQQDKIIVSLSGAVIALCPETGRMLWRIDFEGYNPIEIVFEGNTGYIGERLYYAVVDIEKGIKIFASEFDHDIEIEGNKINWINSGSGLVLHDGFLWCVFNEKGNCYLVKLNPENGKFIKGMKLATQTPSTRPPVFDENRVYILDQDGVLYIYEEQD